MFEHDDRNKDAIDEGEHRATEAFILGTPVQGDPSAPNVGPTPAGRILIAGLSETEGNLGEFVEAKLTRWEVGHVVRYWHNSHQNVCKLGIEGYSGSQEWRVIEYAEYRLDALIPYCSGSFQAWLDADAERWEKKAERLQETLNAKQRSEAKSEDAYDQFLKELDDMVDEEDDRRRQEPLVERSSDTDPEQTSEGQR